MPKLTALLLLSLAALPVVTCAQDTARIGLLLRLAAYQIKKPGEFKIDLDSAAGYVAQAQALNKITGDQRLEGLIALTNSWLHEESGQRDQAQKDAEDAIRFYTAYGKDPSGLGESWFQHSRFYLQTIDIYPKIAEEVVRAADYFHRDGNLEREAYTRQFLGDILTLEFKYTEAHRALEQALLLYRQLPGAKLEGVYDLLGYNSALYGDYAQAIKYGLLATKTAEAHLDSTTLMVTIDGRLAYAYLQQNEFDNAIASSKKALRLAERQGDPRQIYIIAGLTATCLALDSRPLESLQLLKAVTTQHPSPDTAFIQLFLCGGYLRAYTRLKAWDQAQKTVDRLFSILYAYHSSGAGLATYYMPVIEYFLRARKLDSARKYIAAQSFELHRYGNSRFFRSLNTELRYKLDTAEHNYKAAAADLMTHKLIHDSLLDEKKVTEIADLEMEYETAKKEDSLKLKDLTIRMLTSRELLQQANLRRAELLRNVMIVAGCLLGLLLTLLYRQYRNKQKANRIISEQNQSMQQLLVEKESLLGDNHVLMQELHHRIKNNLQMITSLLEAQSANLEAEALLAVQKSQHRVQVIALIHQKLYLREDITAVLMSVYLSEIADYLHDSLLSYKNIVFLIDLDPIELDVDKAIPIGLIVNEAITNSIKYAFPDDRKGRIGIALKRLFPNEISLTISDNGVGFPQDDPFDKGDSLGFNLIRGLSKSLHGMLTINSESGTTIELIFPVMSN